MEHEQIRKTFRLTGNQKMGMRTSRSWKDGALTVLKTCMGFAQGESILILYDARNVSRAIAVRRAAENLGASKIYFERIAARPTREPPKNVGELMRANDVSTLCVDEKKTLLLGHSEARREACRSGARVGFVTQSLVRVPSEKELLAIQSRSNRIARMLERARRAKIFSDRNYELSLQFARGERSSLPLSSILKNKGDWGAVPDYAEAAISPLEETAEGDVYVDSIIGIGKSPNKIKITFEKGRIVSILDGAIATKLRKVINTDSSSNLLGELGIGANHLRKKIVGEFDDKKMLGSIHLGIGDNHTIGGKIISDVHIDCLVASPMLELDNKVVDFDQL